MNESRLTSRFRSARARMWGVGAVTVTAIWWLANFDRTSSMQAQPPTEPLAISDSHQFVGVGSCTAAGCHGGGKPDAIVGSEYNIWISRDPHAKAYSDLFSERSQRMVRLLAGNTDQRIAPAHEDRRCLACHSTIKADAAEAALDEQELQFAADGVGCEACHGPASDWLGPHTERRLSQQEREQLGMTDTDALRVRAQVCVACHVGGPGRDVNHDLIAAGHPLLQFSMTAHWEALPKHWIGANDRARLGATFDAALWAFGQAATAEAALRQLERRAAPGQPWPEFAELNCTACHHDLIDDVRVQQAVKDRNNLSGRRIDSDPWNLFAPGSVAVEMNTAFGGDEAAARVVEQSLNDLTNALNSVDFSGSNRNAVGNAASIAAGQVDGWVGGFRANTLDRQRANRLMQAVIAHVLAEQDADWSTIAQAYDALASLQQTTLQYDANDATKAADAAVTKLLGQLFDELSAAPRGTVVTQTARQHLQELGRLLSSGGGTP